MVVTLITIGSFDDKDDMVFNQLSYLYKFLLQFIRF